MPESICSDVQKAVSSSQENVTGSEEKMVGFAMLESRAIEVVALNWKEKVKKKNNHAEVFQNFLNSNLIFVC